MKARTLLKTDRFRVSFAWYDLWIGLYIDADNRRLYICPVPALLFTICY